MEAAVIYNMFAAIILTTYAVVSGSPPLSLTLERIVPNHGTHLHELRARDNLRHGRLLKSSEDIVDFYIDGTFQPIGLYYTILRIGTPPVQFYVLIDTGSDFLWISCSSCDDCPKKSGLDQIGLRYFEPINSSTSSSILCSDQRCDTGICQNNQCAYNVEYGKVNGSAATSGTSGYYVSDRLHLDTIFHGLTTHNSSAPIVFGCSNQRSGYLSKSERALDGIFGFGHQDISVISQLSAQWVGPRVFSHCLRGDIRGGGTLVLGEMVEPDIVYTPLDLSQPHYNVNLESISVNGWKLQIDGSVFATSKDRGTIIDSGTTLAYLPEEAYDPFVDAITAAMPHSVHTFLSEGHQCFLTTDSVTDTFPQVSLNFDGGASMDLRPQDYLVPLDPKDGAAVWCIGFMKFKGPGLTILGDIVLKDKIFVYDLDGERIGWAAYDCSLTINASATISPSRHVNTGKFSRSSCLDDGLMMSFLVTLTLCLMFL